MTLNQLLLYLEQPIIFYTIILTIIWVFLLVISSKDYSKQYFLEKTFAKNVLIIAFLSYMILIFILAILNEISFFPIIHAVMVGITLLTILSLKSEESASAIHLCLVFFIALAPVIVMISTKHPYPLGDDARFPGFAFAISKDGRWIPNMYAENPFYQFFHLIPFMEYVLASVAGIDLNNVAGYYLILKICMYLSYILSAYLFTKEITKSSIASLSAIMLLSITPPLAMSQVVHQGYAIILFLCTSFLLLKRLNERSSANYTIAIFPLLITGVVAHATFTLMLMVFAIPLMLIGDNLASKRSVGRFLLLLTVASLSYWIYTYVFDIIVRPGVDAIDKLVDLFTGRAVPWQEIRQTWYSEKAQYFFVAWALIPSTVGAFILFPLLQLALYRKRLSINLVALLGMLGLAGTVLNYVLRTLPTFGGRYFYWLYLLMLPLSAIFMTKVSRRFTSFMVTVLLISIISFYGIQDPTMSANTYGKYIGWADKASWDIARLLVPHICSDGIRLWLDPRIGSPVSALTLPPLVGYMQKNIQNVFVIIGMDNVGLGAMQNDPRSFAFFNEFFGFEPKILMDKLQNFDIIFNGGQYMGIMK